MSQQIYEQNFTDETIIPHPYEEGVEITLGDLKNIQNELKKKLNLNSTFDVNSIKYVGGVDIGHHKTDPKRAKIVISIFEYQSLKEVYRYAEEVELTFPYISGFLGFREVNHFMKLLAKVKEICPQFYPDVLLVDGNGLLHYHSFGSACHLGVEANIPTIGVGKTLYCIDGLKVEDYKGLKDKKKGDSMTLVGDSGKVWGSALWTNNKAQNCIFVSQGHNVSLDDAIKIILKCSKVRIPEPIRQADLMSKHF